MPALPPQPGRPDADVLAGLVGEAVASRVASGDPALWPAVARPGWAEAARRARPLVGEIEGLRERMRVAGQVRVVLAAAGGVGPAAEALADADARSRNRLIVLDTTDPGQVADALAGELAATTLVVSLPPGEDATAVELLRDTAHRAFRAEGLDPAAHTVLVTAPGTPLEQQAGGAVVVPGPSDVDGPWAALTAYALVPAGLAGVDVGAVLTDAAGIAADLAADTEDNPALGLGALLAAAPLLAVASGTAGGTALAEWVAQLVGGGLGKDGRGPLVIPVEGPDAPEWAERGTLTLDALTVGLGDVPGAALITTGPPAAQMLHWQVATAVAAHLLGVDPTDRPDATAPAAAAGPGEPVFTEGDVEVHAGPWLPSSVTSVHEALRELVRTAARTGPEDAGAVHLSVHAYLDRVEDASAAVLRPELTRRTGLPTTFGWAPRHLPGTGQRDKGGPPDALVCQLTGAVGSVVENAVDNGSADAAGSLGELQLAQARADAAALAARGLPVLRLHFTDRLAGLVTLARAVQEL